MVKSAFFSFYKRTRKLQALMKPKGHVVINITDVWDNSVKFGRRRPLHIAVCDEMAMQGFELRNIIIWNKRNLIHHIGIFGWPSNYITLGATSHKRK